MRKFVVMAGVALATAVFAAPAPATIHPLEVGWVCGNASGDPPGQTPGATHSDQSTFRAVLATGVIVIVNGVPQLDPNNPASKFSTFNVFTETGTPSNQGALNCAGANG
jgi:hypothetical protein